MANTPILLTHAALEDMMSKPFDMEWVTKYGVDRDALEKAAPGKDHFTQMIRYKKSVHLGDWLRFDLGGQKWTVAVVEAEMTSRKFSVVAIEPPGAFARGVTGFKKMTDELLASRRPQANQQAARGRRLMYRDIDLLRNGEVIDNLAFVRSAGEFWEKATWKHRHRAKPHDDNGILTCPLRNSFPNHEQLLSLFLHAGRELVPLLAKPSLASKT
ncbi:MAG: hypothetical protein Q9174_004046, partial [Haloplaca sp. 1 TL-2023]